MKNLLDVLIEIPQGTRSKYEYDFELKRMRFDRMVHTSMVYPVNYGFVPETLALDGDPLDVLVLSKDPLLSGCVVAVKPVGVLKMSDEKGADEKLLCVPVKDPFWNKVTSLKDITDQRLNEIEHFFKAYKDLENKEVIVEGWLDVDEAVAFYEQSVERYNKSEHKQKGDFTI